MSLLSGNRSFSSPKSKSKVVRFSLNYDLKNLFLDVVNEKDRHLYEEFICKIRDLGQGIHDDELVQLLKEARGCISILDRNLILFVQVILLLKWSHRSEEVVSEYQGFLLDLCSAHTYYAKNVIDHLVSYFKNGVSDFTSGKPQEDEVLHFQNVHSVIKTLLGVIPMSSDLLVSSIDKCYPYIKRPPCEHASFIYNSLLVINYTPSLRVEILKIICRRIVSIDVSVPRSDSTNVLVTSLDLCMNVFLSYVQCICHDSSGNLNFQNTKSLYCDLIKVFESVLLLTHGTTHVQFIIFYLLSFKPVLNVGFMQLLWGKVTNPNVSPVIRQACLSYIASLLSRAGYLSVGLVKDMLSEMSNYVHNYIASQETVQSIAQDTRIHGVFYSVCQALFYVIAFRHKELVDCKKGLLFLNGLNLSKIVQCRLNPLKSCQPAVAQHFASIARSYQLAYCYSIIERNMRSTLPQLTRDQTGNEIILQPYLETFFPFDPYTLPISEKFVKPIYREYNDDLPEQTDSKISHEAMEEDDDFLEPSSILSHSPSRSVALLSQSPGQMSFLSQSPKQSFLNFSYGNQPGFLHIT